MERCELVELQCDAGMVQIDSLKVDAAASIRQAVEFQTRVPTLIATEAAYLRESGARVVVADIPPLAVAAARAAGIPSVVIGNFTWDWIYEDYRDEGALELARDIRALYRHATSRPSTAHVRRLLRARVDDARHPVHRAALATRAGRGTSCARTAAPRHGQTAGADVVRRVRRCRARHGGAG